MRNITTMDESKKTVLLALWVILALVLSGAIVSQAVKKARDWRAEDDAVRCVPCGEKSVFRCDPFPEVTDEGGFRYFARHGGDRTVCVPCSRARTPDQLYVCTGLTYTPGARP